MQKTGDNSRLYFIDHYTECLTQLYSDYQLCVGSKSNYPRTEDLDAGGCLKCRDHLDGPVCYAGL